jgi:photosystem II stability/assembly factor-like uncharacterized protein
MNKYLQVGFFFVFATSIILVMACKSTTYQAAQPDALTRKMEPYDHMTWQRSWPDTTFDWRGWRQTLRQARMGAEAARLNGCTTAVSFVPWTLQGPSNVPGRVNALAVQPNNEDVVLAGFAGGGIFKTTDAGLTWRPVFDDFEQLSIGDLAFVPSNPQIVYAGTGDVNMPSLLYNGDGLYRSVDAGETWAYVGLSDAGIISKIVVHPTQPNTIWVATMGNPYQRTPQRGVFKTTDGGQSWQKVLYLSDQAGCSSLVIAPDNPNVLYASFWDRIRNNRESVVYGPNAKVYKSTDGGQNWTQLTNGLPTGTNGRTGLAISATNPNRLYVLYIDSLSTPGSLHVSSNAGATWQAMDIAGLENACADFGWYFGKITLNPYNHDDIYFHAIRLLRQNGPGAWQQAANGHADSHELVFCQSGRRYWANDGGVMRYNPVTQEWIQCTNLPATQVYRTAYNPHQLSEYWLGAQDNGFKRGSAAGLNTWTHVFTADGFRVLFHPTDPQHWILETQNGGMHTTTNGGATYTSTNTAFGTPDRVNWDAPVIMSKYPPYTLYAGTYRLYSGPAMNAINIATGDLTDGNLLGSRFHTISTLSESPLVAGRLFVGTSDANVWRVEMPSGGATNITAGLPERYVTSVVGSSVQPDRVFVTHSGFRDDDPIPHIHRSDNLGSTWTDISGDLPQLPVNQLFIVPGYGDSVLCAATDAGVYVTYNGGTNWVALGVGMPSVPIFDFAYHPVRRELIAGTFGRGVWTYPLDSIRGQASQPTMVGGLQSIFETIEAAGVLNVEMPHVTSTASDSGGLLLLPPLVGCDSVTLRPQRLDHATNGVSTFDLLLISRHILNLEPFDSPYKMIAADANRSNTITSFDIVALRRLILGVDTVLATNTSWRFIPKSHSFQNPQNPFAQPIPDSIRFRPASTPLPNLNFTAVKIGDVNNSANPILELTGGAPEERSGLICPIVAQDVDFQPDSDVEMYLIGHMDDLVALQMALQWDPEVLAWEGMEPLASGLTESEHFNVQHTSKGDLRMACDWPSGTMSSGDQPLLRLRWRALRAGRLSEVVRINESVMPALAWAQGLAAGARPVLYFNAPNQNDIKVRPTLVDAHTPVTITATGDGSIASVAVLTSDGRLVAQPPVPNGARTMTLSASLFGSAGQYALLITDERGQVQVFKIVKN